MLKWKLTTLSSMFVDRSSRGQLAVGVGGDLVLVSVTSSLPGSGSGSQEDQADSSAHAPPPRYGMRMRELKVNAV